MIVKEITKEEIDSYNAEPVKFCKKCLSLRIMAIPNTEDSEYCDECGNAHIGSTHIEIWEQMYRARYKESFVKHDKKQFDKY